MKLSELDYHLPEELIAQQPIQERDSSRLLVLHKSTGETEHRVFRDIVLYLKEGDVLVLNNSKVIPAKLIGKKTTGGRIEVLLLRQIGETESGTLWEALWRGSYQGKIDVSGRELLLLIEGATKRILFPEMDSEAVKCFINEQGKMPLPPYIKREPADSDKDSYQTVYARKEGSIAAPTAGLHFTEALLRKIREIGVKVIEITLHVGVGTFRPIKVAEIEKHHIEPEYFEIEGEVIKTIEETKRIGGRVIAVGTTTTRTLEGFASNSYTVIDANQNLIRGFTDIFIYPSYEFKVVDGLITNFHLPKSSPLALVCAFCGLEKVFKAYQEAIRHRYRFFSYGDAMLII